MLIDTYEFVNTLLAIDNLSIKCQSSVHQVLSITMSIEVLIEGSIEGIKQHLTMNAFNTHDPARLTMVIFRLTIVLGGGGTPRKIG